MSSEHLAEVIDARDAQEGPFCVSGELDPILDHLVASRPYLMGRNTVVSDCVNDEVDSDLTAMLAGRFVFGHCEASGGL